MFHRRDLSLFEKNEILKKYDALPKCSQRNAALKLGIPKSSLSRILQQRHKIYTDINSNCNIERKRKRNGKDFLFGDYLLKFYEDYVDKNGTISRSIIVNKAEELAKEFGLTDFKATDGWLSRWKQRNNLVNKDKLAESANFAEISTTEDIPSILKNYAPDKIFNADITALDIHAYPNCTIKLKSDTTLDKDEKFTVLLACNMVGNKKIPVVVGKNKYLDCFKGIKTLPFQYNISEDALITREIFIAYLREWDRELGYEKIVLVLDYSLNHFKDLSLPNIKLIFLPSVIHPLDQGIIKTFKLLYRKNIQLKVNNALGSSADKILKEITLVDAIHFIANAWLNVSAMCVYNSFKKAGFFPNSDQLESIVNILKKETESNKKFYFTPSACESNISDENVTDAVDMIALSEETLIVPDVIIKDENVIISSEEMNTNPYLKDDIIIPDIDVQGEETVLSQEVKINNSLKNSIIERNGILSSNIETKNDLERNQKVLSKNAEDNFTAEETRHALFVIRKTLEQRGASIGCYELFYKMENEVNKLLQNT